MKIIKVKKDIKINRVTVLMQGIYDLNYRNIIEEYPFIDFSNEEYFEISDVKAINVGSVVNYKSKYWYVMKVDEVKSDLTKKNPNVTYYIASSKTAHRSDWRYVYGSELVPCETYWFINSEGCLHEAIKGKNPRADHFREMSGNVFLTKEAAGTTLNEILHSTSVTA